MLLKSKSNIKLFCAGFDQLGVQFVEPRRSLEKYFRLPTFRSGSTLLLTPQKLGALRASVEGILRSRAPHLSEEFIIRGIGYKFRFYRSREEAFLSFRLGYAHRILFPLALVGSFMTNKRYDFVLSSRQPSQFRQVAEALRGLRPSHPYKGKGLKYDRAPLVLKVGKVR